MSTRVNNLGQMMPQLQPGSASVSRNHSKRRRVSWENVEHVLNLIEACLQLHKNKDEAVKTLLTLAKIEPEVTTTVWDSLEEENHDFFVTYYIGLELEKKISQFNRLIKNQYPMKCLFPKLVLLAPEQNGIHSMPVNNRATRSPVLQQPSFPAAGRPHIESTAGHPIQTNSGNGMVMDSNALNTAPIIPPNGAMSSLLETPVNPTSVASNGYFPSPASTNFHSIRTNFGNCMVMDHGAPDIPPNGAMPSLLEMPVNRKMVPLAPEQNGIHPMPVNHPPMRYPVQQEPSIPAAGQPHIESIGADISSCYVVREVPASSNIHPIQTNSGNGMVMDHSALDMASVIPPSGTMAPPSPSIVNNLPMSYPVLQQPSIPVLNQPHSSICHVVSDVPASSNFHPIQTNSGNGMVMDHSALDMASVIPSNGAMSPLLEMPVNPASSVPSNGHFPSPASEISALGTDASTLDTVFTSDVAGFAGLQLAPNNDLPDLSFWEADDFFDDSEPVDSCRPDPLWN